MLSSCFDPTSAEEVARKPCLGNGVHADLGARHGPPLDSAVDEGPAGRPGALPRGMAVGRRTRPGILGRVDAPRPRRISLAVASLDPQLTQLSGSHAFLMGCASEAPSACS